MDAIATGKAWDAIGWDDGKIKIKGGRAIYEAIFAVEGRRGQSLCKLARLASDERGLYQLNRYVDPDTEIEFLTCEKTSKLDFPNLNWVKP